MSSLSKPGRGFPRAPASGCPSEVVRDQTRDKLRKDKEEIPQPLYLFVSSSAIFACVVVYKVLHDIWTYWLSPLGEIFKGPGASLSCCGSGVVPICAFTPRWASALRFCRSLGAGTGGLCSPQPLSQLARAMLDLTLELSPKRPALGHRSIVPQGASTGWGQEGEPWLQEKDQPSAVRPAASPRWLVSLFC